MYVLYTSEVDCMDYIVYVYSFVGLCVGVYFNNNYCLQPLQ